MNNNKAFISVYQPMHEQVIGKQTYIASMQDDVCRGHGWQTETLLSFGTFSSEPYFSRNEQNFKQKKCFYLVLK